jgi:hypothetical protein
VPLDPPKNAAPPHAVEAPAEHHALAGLDDDGRPVLVRGAFGLDGERPRAVLAHPGEERDEFVLHSRVLRWDGPRLEVIGFLTHSSVSHVTRVEHDAAGRPIRFATAGVPYNALGKGAELAECVWEGDRCVRVERRVAGDRGRIHEETRTGEYDEAGLVRVVRGDGMVI